MTQNEPTKEKASRHPGLWDLSIASLIYGAIPLVAVLSGGANNPLLFLILYRGGDAIGMAIYLYFKQFDWSTSKGIIKLLLFGRRNDYTEFVKDDEKIPSIFNILNYRSILISINGLTSLLFAWSLVYVHTFVAVVIAEIYPIFSIILLSKISNKEFKINNRIIFLNIVALLAVVLVVLSDSAGGMNSVSLSWSYIFGLVLLIATIIFTLQSTILVRRGQLIARKIFSFGKMVEEENTEELKEKEKNEKKEREVAMFLRMFSAAFIVVIVFVLFLIFEIFNLFQGFSGTLSIQGVCIALVGGLIIRSVGGITNIRGTIKAKDLRVQAVKFLTPVFGVLLLVISSPLKNIFPSLANQLPDISDIIWPWFVAGLLGILVTNIVINFKSEEKKFGLTSLVVTLWLSGVLVFFRDEWNWWLDSINLLESGILEYYGFLGAVATIFALLLGFEINRIEQRTTKEEEGVFEILQRLNMLYPSDTKIQKYLEDLDTATNSDDIKKQYLEISKKLEGDLLASRQEHNHREGRVAIDDNSSQYLNDTISKLNTVAHSKQQGRGIAESIAIVLLAGFTAVLSFALRPSGTEGFIAILVDSFGFLLAGIVAYLVFHLYDLRSSRTGSIMERTNSAVRGVEVYRVEFHDSGTRGEATVASMLVVVIVVTYFVLFSLKWLL